MKAIKPHITRHRCAWTVVHSACENRRWVIAAFNWAIAQNRKDRAQRAKIRAARDAR